MNDTLNPVPLAVVAAHWCNANRMPVSARLILLLLAAAYRPDHTQPIGWPTGQLARLTDISPPIVREGLHILRKRDAIRIGGLPDGERVAWLHLPNFIPNQGNHL